MFVIRLVLINETPLDYFLHGLNSRTVCHSPILSFPFEHRDLFLSTLFFIPPSNKRKMRRLPQETVQKATVQLRNGKSAHEVPRALDISISAAINIRKDDEENIPPPKVGRPSKVSKATNRYLAREYDTGQIKTLLDGQRLLQSMGGVHVQKKTVWNYLKEEGLRGYVCPKKPRLTKDK